MERSTPSGKENQETHEKETDSNDSVGYATDGGFHSTTVQHDRATINDTKDTDNNDSTDRNRTTNQEGERKATETERGSKDNAGYARAGGTHSETVQVKDNDESMK